MAAEPGISRNQIYVTAIQKFARGQKRKGITEALNRVYEKVDQSPDPYLEALQLATLKRDPVVIHPRGTEDAALVSASELRSLELTLHELRSPRNAARLFAALARALSRETEPQSVETLREELGSEKAK
jgi:antitoxin YefM